MQDGAGGEGGIHLLLNILADGEEQARRLGELPDDPQSRAEYDYRGAARRLQGTLGKAVSVAKAMEAKSGSSRGTDRSDSPRSADESSGGTTAMETQERQGVCKRRKGLPRWTAKFRVPDANLEATPDDGFSWRKYGQKDILGAKFPRGYYRCTYRASQGCPATKQVQRSDSDLCVFDVTYQGAHTCHQKQRHATPSSPAKHGDGGGSLPAMQDPSMQLLAGFNDCLKVETTEAPAAPLYTGHDQDPGGPSAPPAASFSFPTTQFPADVAPGDPAAASYFYDYELPAARMPGADSELGEVVSKATSAAGFDYSMYHHGEFDPHLPFAPFGGPHQ